MKRRMKKLLALLLCSATLLTACGSPGDAGSSAGGSDSGSSAGTESSESDGGGSGQENNSESKETTTLTFYSMFAGSNLDDAEWFRKLIREKFNIELDVAAGNGDDSVIQAFLASGELTDITAFRDAQSYQAAAQGGMLINLDDYKDKLPNLYENPDYEAAIAHTRDLYGGLYAMPTQIGENGGLFAVPQMRWDLYQQLGRPKIETPEDLLTVLKQMQELEPVSREGANTYGFQLWNDWDGDVMLGFMMGLWMLPTGYYATGPGGICEIKADGSGAPKGMFDEDSHYMEGIRFMFQANQMGLIDPDSASQNEEAMNSKIMNGGALFTGYDSVKYGDTESAEGFYGLATVLPEYFQCVANADRPVGYRWRYGISSKCKNVDKALELLNWYYGPEGINTILNGPEGVLWEWKDGKQVATQTYLDQGRTSVLAEGGTVSNASSFWGVTGYNHNYKINPESGQTYRLKDTDPDFRPQAADAMKADWQSVYGEYSAMYDYVAEADGGKHLIRLNSIGDFIEPKPDEMDSITKQIDAIVIPAQWQAIFAKDEAEFNAIIDQARADAEALGYSRVVEDETARWEAAKKIAENYGVKVD